MTTNHTTALARAALADAKLYATGRTIFGAVTRYSAETLDAAVKVARRHIAVGSPGTPVLRDAIDVLEAARREVEA
jgi:hypothetical protein